MGGLIRRRLVGLVPVLLLVSLVTFAFTYLLPGDPAVAVAGPDANPEQVERARRVLNLDDSPPERYVDWLGGALTGDFGESVVTGRSIADEITRRVPATASVALAALVLAIGLGLTFGVVQGMYPDTIVDRVLLIPVTLGLSVPNFWLATILVSIFAVDLGWFPAIGYEPITESPLEWLKHITLPAVTLALYPAAEIARQLRTGLVSTLDADYIRAARARGYSRSSVVLKHALTNASAPAVTIIGLRIGYLFAGSVIIEQIFLIPGLGRYTLAAIQTRDIPVIQAVILLAAIIVTMASLIVDITYAKLNPKVRVA